MMRANGPRRVAVWLLAAMLASSTLGTVRAQGPDAPAEPAPRAPAGGAGDVTREAIQSSQPAKDRRPKIEGPAVAVPRPAATARAASCRQETGPYLVDFGDAAPYPMPDDSTVPDTGEPFFSHDASGRLFHDAPRGGRLFKDQTYSDSRSLVVVPPRFDPDPAKRPVVVLFFHGNLATLRRDVVGRQRVVDQVERSGLNAVLVAPQLACNALDSSPGRFYRPGFLDTYLREAAQRLAERSRHRFEAEDVARWPVILVAYSGGYLATAYALSEQSEGRRRVGGVVLLDALFGEEGRFAAWIKRMQHDAFFVSAYSPSSAALNGKLAADLQGETGLRITHELPDDLHGGAIVLRAVPGAGHNDFVTTAWTRDPLRDVLSRVDLGNGAPRRPGPASPIVTGAVAARAKSKRPPSGQPDRPASTKVDKPSACPADQPDCTPER